MDFTFSAFSICLCILASSILLLIYFTRMWKTDIRTVSSRLHNIEKELHYHQHAEGAIYIQPEEQKALCVSPPLLKKEKPTDTNQIRCYIELHSPTLIDEINDFSPEKLTQTDELLCMMIKLGYKNKEIASILSITTNSVLTARYRLKKKLQLPGGRQLDSWISCMGNRSI